MTLARAKSTLSAPDHEVMRRVNLMLFRDTKDKEFVTLFYGVLDARTRRLTYSNAGHPPGLLLRDGKVSELPGGNMVLGVDPNEPYTQAVLDLRSNDVLLLYTDGLDLSGTPGTPSAGSGGR